MNRLNLVEKIILAVALMIVGKYAGDIAEDSMVEKLAPAKSAASKKLAEDASLEDQRIITEALKKPATPYCLKQGVRYTDILEQEIEVYDRQWFVETFSRACTGGGELATVMRVKWGASDEEIYEVAADINKKFPMIKTRFEAVGFEPEVAFSISNAMLGAINIGFVSAVTTQ